jgi:uncharacterized membrane protein YdcZ (DUF606 family)
MMPFLRTLIYRCCSAIAFLSGIAALTIIAAIATNKLTDPEDWVAALFFIVAGAAALLVATVAR